MTSNQEDDLDIALGLGREGGFGRPKAKKRSEPAKASPSSAPATPIAVAPKEERPVPSSLPATAPSSQDEPPASRQKLPTDAAATPMPPLEPEEARAGAVSTAVASATSVKRSGVTESARAPGSSRRVGRGRGEANYGRLVTLRLAPTLFERLEAKSEELDARSVGQLVVALIKAAVEDPAMLGPIARDTGLAASRGGKDLVLALLKSKTQGDTQQITIRLPRSTYAQAVEAGKRVGERKVAPYLVALVERQLGAL